MQETCFWTVRVSVLLLLLRSHLLDSQHTLDHRKVPQRPESQHGIRTEQGEGQGSWGSWGPWSSCSRTCGKGVQEQTRPCLPARSQYSSRGVAAQPQQPTLVISALKPGVSPQGAYNSSSSGDGRTQKQIRPNQRRRVSQMIPGRYGYGRAPYVASPQTNRNPGSGTPRRHRQRRSPAAMSYHNSPRSYSGRRSNNLNNPHLSIKAPTHSRTHHPRNNQVWAPLYQPVPAGQGPTTRVHPEMQTGGQTPSFQQHLDRPYDPLPSSSCTGEHAHHRLCNSNACPPSSKHIRAVQCSSYNNQPFMGRVYEWEPFNDGPGEQNCELNCRAKGFRFYVQQSERVIDGTPCGKNETFLCVAGKCTVGHLSTYQHSAKE